MNVNHYLQNELLSLRDQLLHQSPASGGQDAKAHTPSSADLASIMNVLEELQTALSEAAGDGEEFIASHPLAAVASGFLLGVLVGRIWSSVR